MIRLILTFDDSSEREFIMSEEDYSNLKRNIEQYGSKKAILIGLGSGLSVDGGEFILPWGKVKFAEALLYEEQVAQSPVNAQASPDQLQLVRPKS